MVSAVICSTLTKYIVVFSGECNILNKDVRASGKERAAEMKFYSGNCMESKTSRERKNVQNHDKDKGGGNIRTLYIDIPFIFISRTRLKLLIII